ncbi:MAG: DNA repair protein RecN [Flavobacteriaceae bacterium]|nr:DNA repair protein RecN [Flavobacteriaceae bacterium]
MLTTLSIKNYALIENLNVSFHNGFSTITGETGAGKSILLGGLALVLGKRADASLVYNKEKKCIIEVDFDIKNYSLNSFFEKKDLDYESVTTIRREILPNGKSRAFINDTPVTLTVLTALSEQLIDIHSQHETLQLADRDFQFQIIDALAKNERLLVSYTKQRILYKDLLNEMDILIQDQKKAKESYDYNMFLLNELEDANLKEADQIELEENLDKLSHVEEIKKSITESVQIADEEQIGLKDLFLRLSSSIYKITTYADQYQQLFNRLQSISIELSDIVDELESENENLEFNPFELEKINEKLQVIYSLQKKHSIESINDLLEIKNELQTKVNVVEGASKAIHTKKEEIEKEELELSQLSLKIHKNRKKAIPVFIKKLEAILTRLEMKNTRFSIDLVKTNEFLYNGKDTMFFKISADKGKTFESLKKVASGGEMSRIMLSVKTILSKYTKLPAIIFDEIDTGVSGEVSNKIAELMIEMSVNMQVIAITHLPQIAAKGNHHYKVFKKEMNNTISSNIKLLDKNERINELAEMLGGKSISKTAMDHAKQLLH